MRVHGHSEGNVVLEGGLEELGRKVNPAVDSNTFLTCVPASPLKPASVMRGEVRSFS